MAEEPRVAMGVVAFARLSDDSSPDLSIPPPGRVVKVIDREVLLVFVSVAAATDCLCGLRASGAVSSAAISCGDVTFEQGDVFGTPVVEASRLLGHAEPGEILAVRRLGDLLDPDGSHPVLEPRGDLPLRGLPEPVRTLAIR